MKKAYYTQLSVISLDLTFLVVIEGVSHKVELESKLGLTQTRDENIIHNTLHKKVSEILGDDDFFLIPSRIQVELDSYHEYVKYNPAKFPMEDDEYSCGFGSMRNDS